MNYINLIIVVGIFIFLFDKFFSNSQKNYNIISDYSVDIDKNDTGFIKPEHRLFKILGSISGGSKIKLNGNTRQYIYSKNTISTELNEKLILLGAI